MISKGLCARSGAGWSLLLSLVGLLLPTATAAHDPKEKSPHVEAGPAHRPPPGPPQDSGQSAPGGPSAGRAAPERGKNGYEAPDAICHGPRGAGDGPAAASLQLKPPSLEDSAMVAEMTPAYWLWRVSEGGAVEPYRSKGSVMPAYRDTLSIDDRWAVIAYQH